MQTIAIGITTYERPRMLKLLLDDILREKNNYNFIIKILDDGSYQNYSFLKEYENIKYIRQPHLGKRNFWLTVTRLYCMFKGYRYDYIYHFADDFRLKENYFRDTIKIWKSIKDERKIVLNTLSIKRKNTGWINFKPIKRKHYSQTQWYDVHFMSDYRYLNVIKYTVPNTRFWENGSSGVGYYLTKLINNLEYNIYQTNQNFIGHGTHESKMHKEERKKNPLIGEI